MNSLAGSGWFITGHHTHTHRSDLRSVCSVMIKWQCWCIIVGYHRHGSALGRKTETATNRTHWNVLPVGQGRFPVPSKHTHTNVFTLQISELQANHSGTEIKNIGENLESRTQTTHSVERLTEINRFSGCSWGTSDPRALTQVTRVLPCWGEDL